MIIRTARFVRIVFTLHVEEFFDTPRVLLEYSQIGPDATDQSRSHGAASQRTSCILTRVKSDATRHAPVAPSAWHVREIRTPHASVPTKKSPFCPLAIPAYSQ